MEMFWFIPTTGDGRYLGSSNGSRLTDYAYLRQIAQAVDELGYGAVLLPTGNSCEDAWVVASTLVPSTKRLKFLVAVRPGVMSPTLAARMTATFDRLSQGRVLINVVTGGDPHEAAADGVFLSHDERYEVTGEFQGLSGFENVIDRFPKRSNIISVLFLLCSRGFAVESIATLRIRQHPGTRFKLELSCRQDRIQNVCLSLCGSIVVVGRDVISGSLLGILNGCRPDWADCLEL